MSTRRGLLVQRPDRRSAAGGSNPTSSPPSVPLTRLASVADLPAHQTLELPLSEAAMHKIAEISNRSSSLRVYETQLKKSAELMREAVTIINETLTERNLHLDTLVEKRLEKGRDEPGDGEKDMRETVERLQSSVKETTTLIEQAARTTIDQQMELEDEREALRTMASRLVARQAEDRQRRQEQEEQRAAAAASGGRRRQKRRTTNGEEGQEGDDDDDDEEDIVAANTYQGPPPVSAISLLTEERAVRAAVYAQMSAYQKYSLNNDYIAFKQAWHYSMFPDSDVPLPVSTSWFDAAGEPVATRPGRGTAGGAAGADAGAGGDADGDDKDADLVLQREVISFLCPLSLVTMKDPYRSNVCPHTFEYSAILEYLGGGPAATRNQPKECPQTGCGAQYTAKDLVPDTEMRRRIQRAAKMELRRQDVATSDIDADDGNGPEDAQDVDDLVVGATQRRSMAENAARRLKRERSQRL